MKRYTNNKERNNILYTNSKEYLDRVLTVNDSNKFYHNIIENTTKSFEMLSLFYSTLILKINKEEFNRQNKDKKIKEIKTDLEQFTEPSLQKLERLVFKCNLLINNKSLRSVRNFQEKMCEKFTHSSLDYFLSDVAKIYNLLDDNNDINVSYKNISNIKNKSYSLLDLIKLFAKFSKSISLDSLREILENNSHLIIEKDHWKNSFLFLLDKINLFLTLPFYKEKDPVFKKRTEVYENSTYSVTVKKYINDDIEISTKDIENKDSIDTSIRELDYFEIKDDQNNTISVDLSPFLIIQKNTIYYYKKTTYNGFLYYSILYDESRKESFGSIKKISDAFFITNKALENTFFWVESEPIYNPSKSIKANIPIDSMIFVGRERQIKKIYEDVICIPNNNGIIIGSGGVGKTAILIELTRKLFEEKLKSQYSNIIWCSSKSDYYNPTIDQVIYKEQQYESLENIFNVVLSFFEVKSWHNYSYEDKESMFLDIVEENLILLILDNFENIKGKEKEKIIKFFNLEVKRKLKSKPENFKIIITSREFFESGFYQFPLKGLDLKESKKLIQETYLKYYKNNSLKLEEKQIQEIIDTSKGIPIVIKHLIGQIFEFNRSFSQAIASVKNASSSVINFSYKELFGLLVEEDDYRNILLILEIYRNTLSENQIATILGNSQNISEKIITLMNYQCIDRIYENNIAKYQINEQIKLFVLSMKNKTESEIVNHFTEKIRNSLNILDQLEMTEEEKQIIGIFNEDLEKEKYVTAESFIKNNIQKFPKSISLKHAYAKFLKERKNDYSAAIQIILSIDLEFKEKYLLLFLASCYLLLDKPDLESAKLVYAEIKTLALSLEDKLEIAEFYLIVAKFTQLKYKHYELLKEIHNITEYQDYATKAKDLLFEIESNIHQKYYLLSLSYFFINNTNESISNIDKAINTLGRSEKKILDKYISFKEILEYTIKNKNKDKKTKLIHYYKSYPTLLKIQLSDKIKYEDFL